ncbi:hypothetical protein Desor_2215 [Desulfosporosinus orientis DSM 765]|uniref:Lipoprotein n=1 Tax=Desulfosporosinus orientis (strain ATCC 19365 / DSM 765 / NCIMB 8382 / VKM B-1628 / Singapore I) TaxID=768706 RepID=G7W8V7_DESOD|nr:hypothetical protein [Desulfosporosinus orientis]AET67817.1 hypothetical protein Desor_2215 [Desulfosporosinus orientis DSM 765]
MKKAFVVIAGLILLLSSVICSNNVKQDFYGIYAFEQVCYLSPFSSSTVWYLNKKMVGTKYTIKSDLFKIESNNIYNPIEISSPKYVKEEISTNVSKLADIGSFLGTKVECQYTLETIHMRLYVSSDYLWIASYADNTDDGLEIIMYIYKLSKTIE